MFWHEDALSHGIVHPVVERGTVVVFLDAVEAVWRHLVGRYEDGFSLLLRPGIETLVVELLRTIIYVGALVGNVAVYHAVRRYLHLGIVKHTACDGQYLPPPKWLAERFVALGIASDTILLTRSLDSISKFFF